MKTPSLSFIEEQLRKLMEGEDLNQMRADAKYAYKFRRMIVHEPND